MQTITINCEKLKHPNTGLYHYCLNLSKALLATAPAGFNLQLYAPETAASLFPAGTKIIAQHDWHKLLNPANFSCDLWHATNQEAVYYPRFGKAKKIITVHDLNYFHDPSKSITKREGFLKELKSLLQRSAYLITISRFTLEEVKKYIPVDIPSTVIYNGCNMEDADAAEKPSFALKDPFIFSIGTITDKKNFHVLPALLLNNNYRLVIAGEVYKPVYLEKIKQAAIELGVADRLVFTGAVSEGEKRWLFENCIAFAFPSLQEGFGLPVVEAMAFGKPVFLSKETSLPEIGGTDAFYFDHFEPVYMSTFFDSSLALFAGNATERSAKLIARARDFSWRQAALQHWDIYRQVLQK